LAPRIGPPQGCQCWAGKFQHLLDGFVTSAKADAWAKAARAIMTTDTYPKLATRKARIGNVEVSINGFCKAPA